MNDRLLDDIGEAKSDLQRIRDESSSLPTKRQWASIMLMLLTGLTQRGVGRALKCARSTVPTAVSRFRMGRLLKEAGCRRIRPKPVVSKAAEDKEQQIAAFRKELAELPSSDVVLYSDEVDIHLDP